MHFEKPHCQYMATTKTKRLKTVKVQMRLTEFDMNRIRILAQKYAGGSITKWLTHGALNAPRKFLSAKASRGED